MVAVPSGATPFEVFPSAAAFSASPRSFPPRRCPVSAFRHPHVFPRVSCVPPSLESTSRPCSTVESVAALRVSTQLCPILPWASGLMTSHSLLVLASLRSRPRRVSPSARVGISSITELGLALRLRGVVGRALRDAAANCCVSSLFAASRAQLSRTSACCRLPSGFSHHPRKPKLRWSCLEQWMAFPFAAVRA